MALILVSAFAIPAVSCAAVPASPRYVALGDSYTAGPLVPSLRIDSLGCARSDRNYPHLIAQATGYSLVDMSCANAETEHMFAAQDSSPGRNPAQLDALTADTSLVTLGVGGNDVGLGEVMLGCVSIVAFWSPCADGLRDTVSGVVEERILRTAGDVSAVLTEIKVRSPRARVFVIGYPTILPDHGAGCWPSIPIGRGGVAVVRDVHRRLNAVLARTADANGVEFIDTYGPSIGHDACADPSTRWVEPLVPENPAAPMHTNRNGMLGIARLVQARLR